MARKKREKIKSIIRNNIGLKTKEQIYKIVRGKFTRYGIGRMQFGLLYSAIKRRKEGKDA